MRDPGACALDVAHVVMNKFDRDSNDVITSLGHLAWAIDERGIGLGPAASQGGVVEGGLSPRVLWRPSGRDRRPLRPLPPRQPLIMRQLGGVG